MPLKDLGMIPFDENEQNVLKQLADNLADIVSKKTVQLDSKERQRYGSLNEINKLLVLKVLDYRRNAPELSSPQVDWDMLDQHYASFKFMEDLLDRIDGSYRDLFSSKIMQGYFAVQLARIDYAYTRYLAESGVPNAETKFEDLKQLFKRASQTTEEEMGQETDE